MFIVHSDKVVPGVSGVSFSSSFHASVRARRRDAYDN